MDYEIISIYPADPVVGLPKKIVAWVSEVPTDMQNGLQAAIEGDGLQLASMCGREHEDTRIWLNRENWRALVNFVNSAWSEDSS